MAGIGLPDGRTGDKGGMARSATRGQGIPRRTLALGSAKHLVENCEAACWGLGRLLKAFDGEALDQRAVHGLGYIVAGFTVDLEAALAEIETLESASAGKETNHG
jgi:hypothetical protein